MFNGMNPLQIFLLSGAVYAAIAVTIWMIIAYIRDNRRQLLDWMIKAGEQLQEISSDDEDFNREKMDYKKWRATRL